MVYMKLLNIVILMTLLLRLPPHAEVRTAKSGGNNVRCTYNRPYEAVNLYSGAMTFPSTLLTASNRATEYAWCYVTTT